MKVEFYLIVNDNGKVRTATRKTKLAYNEISIFQKLELPIGLFTKPLIEAVVVIPNSAAVPQEIDAEVLLNAKDAIEQATGMEIKLSIVPQTEE